MPDARWGARPFAEQLAFFAGKDNVPTRAWTDLWHEGHDTGFMVAGAYKAQLLQDLREAVDKAKVDGTTLREFQRDFAATVARHGWSYNGSEGWRTRVIYETNLRSSYAAGRYHQLTDPDLVLHRPWWRYRHSDAVEHPRDEHVAWDGLVLRADDPWWQTHYPPNGWGCRCWVEALSSEDLARLGKTGPDKAPEIVTETVTVGRRGPSPRTVDVPKGIDPGWAYAPGASTISGDARRALRERLPKLHGDLRTAVEARLQVPFKNPGLDEAVAIGRAETQGLVPAGKPTVDEVNAFRSELRRRLGEARSLSTPAATATKAPAAAALLREASTRFPDDWTEFTAGLGRLHIYKVEMRPLQYTLPQGAEPLTLKVGSQGIVTLAPGDGLLVTSGVDDALHEYGHRLQVAMPGLDTYFQEMHRRRTAGDNLRRLDEIYPGIGYGEDELAREDKYVDAYFGKEYADLGDGNPSGALEIMTMTFEALLGDDPQMLQRLLHRDRELVELGTGLLFHYRP